MTASTKSAIFYERFATVWYNVWKRSEEMKNIIPISWHNAVKKIMIILFDCNFNLAAIRHAWSIVSMFQCLISSVLFYYFALSQCVATTTVDKAQNNSRNAQMTCTGKRSLSEKVKHARIY